MRLPGVSIKYVIDVIKRGCGLWNDKRKTDDSLPCDLTRDSTGNYSEKSGVTNNSGEYSVELLRYEEIPMINISQREYSKVEEFVIRVQAREA